MPSSNPLRDHLIVSASQAAKSALDLMPGHLLHEVTSLFLHAGMTVEFLLRAVVAEVSPTLLFVSRNPDKRTATAMVRAHRDAAIDKAWLLSQKSADLSFIRPLAVEIAPALADYAADVDDIVNRRNAVAHMYIADVDARRATLTALVRVADVVLTHFDARSEGFWGSERRALVESLLAESADATRADAALAIHAARIHIEQVKAGLLPRERERVLAALEAQGSSFFPPGPSAVFHEVCPACERQAELVVKLVDDTSDFGALELIEWDDEDGVPGAVLIPQDKVSVQLQCPVCRLRLSYAELQAEFPELAMLDRYEVEPRRGSVSEYEDILVTQEPDWESYPHGSQVG
jgi:hypothetical protein